MAEKDNNPISPTVTKVLDEYLSALYADEIFDDEMAKRLDALLRTGKVPKAEEIDASLYPVLDGESS